jgi:arylsulfatase A-like enzyme
VPLILRPSKQLTAGSAYAPGRRLGGIFDLIDIYPTLLQALQLPCPPALEGSSRWEEIIEGRNIAPHHSLAVDRNQVALCVANETHKYWYCCAPHSVTAKRGYKAGEARWHSIAGTREEVCTNEVDGLLTAEFKRLIAVWPVK